MSNCNMYATLGVAPTTSKRQHNMLYITRGASAELFYPLYDKSFFRPVDVDQVTFSLRQNKQLFWYTMFTYVVASSDIVVNENKTYYTIEKLYQDSLECKLIKVESPEGNPAESEYFEISEDTKLNWKTTYYAVDPHFYWFEDDTYPAIIFNLSSEETKQFKAGINIDYEVSLRLDTDDYKIYKQDSIIVEPQHPIAVIDSLYSKIK